MKIVVTGGTGFIGSHFLRAALWADHEIIALRRPGSNPRVPVSGPVKWADVNLAETDFSMWDPLDASCLVHFASYGVSPQPCAWDQAFQVNVSDSLKTLEAAIQAGIRRVVVCGSCMEYGRSGLRFEFIPPNAPLEPIGAYASSKAAQTVAMMGMARESDIEMIVLRPFTVFGDGQHPSNFWPSLRRAALAGENFPMTSGTQVRDFVKVEEVAKAFLDAATRTNLSAGKPVIENVGTGLPQTLRSFAEAQWEKFNAGGKLMPGVLAARAHEVARYVPEVPINLI